MTARELVTEHLIVTPGQNLTPRETALLACMAEGFSVPEQAKALGMHEDALSLVEGRMRGKLGALSQAHMITRAFLLGVLKPRHLMVLGVIGVIGYSAFMYLGRNNADLMQRIDMANESMGAVTADSRYEQMRARRGH